MDGGYPVWVQPETTCQRVDNFFLQGIPEVEPLADDLRSSSTGLGFSTSAGELWLVEGPIWTLEQKISRYSGAHSFKFGGRFVHNGGGRTNPESPAVTYNTLADLWRILRAGFRLLLETVFTTATTGNSDFSLRTTGASIAS